MKPQLSTSAARRPMGGRSAISAFLLVILGALSLLLPAVFNGYPFLYFDTAEYYTIGNSVVTQVTNLIEPSAAEAPPATLQAGTNAEPIVDTNDSLTYAAGRSPYYGLLIYLSDIIGPMWIVAGVQALLAAWMLFLTARCVMPQRPMRTYAIIITGLTFASTLSYYAAFMMPDVLTGVAILGTAVLAFWYERLSLLERLGLVVVTAFAASTHGTNTPLLVLTLALLSLITLRFHRRVTALPLRAAWSIAPLILSLGAGAAYSAATYAALGEAPHNPPYLMARVLADGTGRAYMKTACATGEPYEICRYKALPLDAHNDILWSTDPKIAVFQLADSAGKRRMIEQERDFVLKTIAAHPGQQIAVVVRHSLAQLVAFKVSSDLDLARLSWEQVGQATLMPTEIPAATHAKAFDGKFPFKAADAANMAGVILALGFLAWRLSRADALAAYRRPDSAAPTDGIEIFAAVSLSVVLLLLANGVMCATLSGVHDRYQARLIWFVPLMALLICMRFGAGARATATS